MQVRSVRHYMLLLAMTILITLGIQALGSGCQGCFDQRACRTHKACRVLQSTPDATADAAEVFTGFACNLTTALCLTKCTQDNDCDICSQYFCDSASGKCVLNTTKEKDKKCCLENTACGMYACNTALGECRTDCTEDPQCNRCRGFFCNLTSKKCETDTAKTKPVDCPVVEPEPIPTPEPTPEPTGDAGTTP